MHLIAPDLLAEAHGLSIGATAIALAIGLFLWVFGWRWHRFWTVAAVTVAGGLYGLSSGETTGGHMVALGLLLAISAGMLALELARLCAFAAGGTAAWLVAGAFFANGPEVGVSFLLGGLVGILFYRLWIMALTSFLGTLLAGHAGLLLLDTLIPFDAVAWAGRNPIGLSVAVGLASALGLAVQGAQGRRGADKATTKKARQKKPPIDDDDQLTPDEKSLRDAFRKQE
jgi:hypothetical protein